MKIAFFGDGLWAAKCLEQLAADGHTILFVAQRVEPSDSSLAATAELLGLDVVTPKDVNSKEFVGALKARKVDLNISMSYDQILKRPIIESADKGFINCHAGKLPYYRGRNVLNWALINGEKEIGITIHYVDEGIDTGDIIMQRLLSLSWEDTYRTVLQKVVSILPGMLSEALKLIEEDRAERLPQAHLEGTYFCKRVVGDEWIDWKDTSRNIYNKIRAITHPGPGARTLLDGRLLIVWEAQYSPEWPKYIATPGEVLRNVPGVGVRVKTGDSTIVLKAVQCDGNGPEELPKFRIGTRFDQAIGSPGRSEVL